MKEKIIYIADDEREFTDKQECIEYEKLRKLVLEEITLFDEEKEIIYTNTLEKMIDVIFESNTKYLKINSNNVVEYFLKVVEENSGYMACFNNITKKGFYFFNELDEEWQDLKQYIKEKEKEIKDFKEFIKNN